MVGDGFLHPGVIYSKRMAAHVSVQGKVKQSKHCDHHRKRKIITNKYKKIKTKNVNKVYVDGSQLQRCNRCHLGGWAAPVLFECAATRTGEMQGWRRGEEVLSSSYSTLTPIFSVFRR